MADAAIKHGEFGPERLRIAFADRVARPFGQDSAFAELLRTQVDVHSRTPEVDRAEDRSSQAESRGMDAAASPTHDDGEPVDDVEEDSAHEEDDRSKDASEETRKAAAGSQEMTGDAQAREGSKEPTETEKGEEGQAEAGDTTKDPPSGELGPGAVEAEKRAKGKNSLRRSAGGDQESGKGGADATPTGGAAEAAEGGVLKLEAKGDGRSGVPNAASEQIASGPTEGPQGGNQKGERRQGQAAKEISSADKESLAKNGAAAPQANGEQASSTVTAGLAGEENALSSRAGNEDHSAPQLGAAERGRARDTRRRQKDTLPGLNKGDSSQTVIESQVAARQGIGDGPSVAPNVGRAATENAAPPVVNLPTGGSSDSSPDAGEPKNTVENVGPANSQTRAEALRSTTQAAASNDSQQALPGNNGAVDRARFMQRVTQAFRAAHERGGHVRLRLHPPELGSLRVDLRVVDNVMSARMEAESATARELLAEHLPVLRQRLAEHGIRVERFELDLMNQDGRDGSQQAFQPPADDQGRRQQQDPVARRRTHVAAPSGHTEGLAVGIRTSSGIDVIV